MKQRSHALAAKIGVDISTYPILHAETEFKAAELGVDLCRSGNAQAMMKGSLHTDELMKAAMAARHRPPYLAPHHPRLCHGHAGLCANSAHHRRRDQHQARTRRQGHIVQNAIDLAHALGIPEPKVALLSAVETVNPKIKSTLEAAALCKMADRGQITGGILDGPLAFDTAVSAKAADIKHLDSPVTGQADILVVPDLESGNMLAKQLRIPRRCATRRHRPRRPRSRHPHQPRRLRRNPPHQLRRCLPPPLRRPPHRTK